MRLLVITGTMGSGKTAVLAETSDLLRALNVEHAAIDLDALGGAYLSNRANNDQTMYENLASISQNYARAGLTRFLVARAIETRAELDRCSKAIGATETVVCRLLASEEVLRRRVAEREQGVRRKEFIQRVSKLTETLDKACLEDFTVSTEDHDVTAVAREVLLRAGWISE